MPMRQPNWTRLLTILLVVLASFAILYVSFAILFRFTQAILLFVLGTLVAYVLSPLVNQLTRAFHVRWLAVLLSYALVAVALFALGLSLFTPFVTQSQSLIDNLHNPSAGSLQGVVSLESDAQKVQRVLGSQRQQLAVGSVVPVSASGIARVESLIARINVDVRGLSTKRISGSKGSRHFSSRRGSASPPPQTVVPASYLKRVAGPSKQLGASYRQAIRQGNGVDRALLNQAYQDAQHLTRASQHLYQVMSTNPILLIRTQVWFDEHGIPIDLQSKFGQAAQQLSNQSTIVLNNAVTIVSETATILLDITLVLIISFYLVHDGGRMIERGIEALPPAYRQQSWFFVQSLDKVLGGYIRGQLALAVLAGILGGGGAAVLGVPYPLLIGLTTAVVQLVPVLGPMLTVIPAVIISLIYMPFLTTVLLAAWFILFQQIVSNIISPRVMGMAVGIPPLEALLAVLIGFPLGGLLGAFLAIPIAGILHILVREAYAYFVLGQSLPPVELAGEPEPVEAAPVPPEQQRRATP